MTSRPVAADAATAAAATAGEIWRTVSSAQMCLEAALPDRCDSEMRQLSVCMCVSKLANYSREQPQ